MVSDDDVKVVPAEMMANTLFVAQCERITMLRWARTLLAVAAVTLALIAPPLIWSVYVIAVGLGR